MKASKLQHHVREFRFLWSFEAVHIETELEINLDEMISKMQSFPGLKVINSDTKFNPTPWMMPKEKMRFLLAVLERIFGKKTE